MRERVEPEVGGENAEQFGQLCALLHRECVRQVVFMLFGDGAQVAEHPVTGVGQGQLVVATIGCATRSGHVATLFERIDQGDNPAGNRAKGARETALADAGPPAENAHHAGLRRRDAERLRSRCKACCGDAADLRQQKPDAIM